jgi:lipoprotein-releasing system permease protein
MGFSEADLQIVFVVEGLALAVIGVLLGWLLGYALMSILGSLRFSIGARISRSRSTAVPGNT